MSAQSSRWNPIHICALPRSLWLGAQVHVHPYVCSRPANNHPIVSNNHCTRTKSFQRYGSLQRRISVMFSVIATRRTCSPTKIYGQPTIKILQYLHTIPCRPCSKQEVEFSYSRLLAMFVGTKNTINNRIINHENVTTTRCNFSILPDSLDTP